MAVAGDIVQNDEVELVVVDVVTIAGGNEEDEDQELAVLRTWDDLALELPVVLPVAGLTVTGHLEPGEVEGWTEVAHGNWEKTS